MIIIVFCINIIIESETKNKYIAKIPIIIIGPINNGSSAISFTSFVLLVLKYGLKIHKVA